MLLTTIKREGLRGLLRGLVPRLYVQVPSSAVTLASYEFAKKLARKERDDGVVPPGNAHAQRSIQP